MNLFAYMGPENIPPTNNTAKYALQDVVVCSKLSGQIRGSESMSKILNFLTCVLMWRSHDKNVLKMYSVSFSI